MLELANSALILAAEEEPSGTDLVLPETAELLWGLICFVVVVGLLAWKVFPRLSQAMEAREQKIQGDLEEAEKTKNEAQSQLDEYKEQLAEARSEANRIIEESRQQAEQVRRDITEKAEKEAESIVARAQEQIQAERNRTVQELQSQIAEMSIQLAEKVVGRSLDDKSQRDLVDAYIREVSGMGNGSGG
jgi:F-type H+-transporting ATPase subunit b